MHDAPVVTSAASGDTRHGLWGGLSPPKMSLSPQRGNILETYKILSVLSHVFGAEDKTNSSFSAHGKIGNFIIVIIIIILAQSRGKLRGIFKF